jgi:hypothetical protein
MFPFPGRVLPSFILVMVLFMIFIRLRYSDQAGLAEDTATRVTQAKGVAPADFVHAILPASFFSPATTL